jgi:exonuclease III
VEYILVKVKRKVSFFDPPLFTRKQGKRVQSCEKRFNGFKKTFYFWFSKNNKFDINPLSGQQMKVQSYSVKIIAILAIFTLSSPWSSFAQMLEDFEEGSKGTYAAGEVTLSTGDWMFDDALLGTLDGDRKNGEQSVRLRDGFIEMLFDYSEGSDGVRFYASNAGFSGDDGGIIRVLYSVDEGDNWQQAGDDIELSDQFVPYERELSVSGPVRFRIERVDGGRISIDDFFIEPFADLAENPTMEVRINGRPAADGDTLSFKPVNTGRKQSVEFRVGNQGEPDLSLNLDELQPSGFYFEPDLDGVIGGGEFQTVSLIFEPQQPGDVSGRLTLASNDPDQPEFVLTLEGEGIDENELISISRARAAAPGTRVTTAGRVSSSGEFGDISFIQHDRSGIAVLDSRFAPETERGDSVRVTGTVSYADDEGESFVLLSSDDQDELQFEIADGAAEVPMAISITMEELNSGDFESVLVNAEDVQFQEGGLLHPGMAYVMSDNHSDGQVYIHPHVTELIYGTIPTQPVSIGGIAVQLDGNRVLMPRDIEDLPVEPFTPEGEEIARNETLDVVTWNIEWFGSESLGPDDTEMQMNNVIKTIRELDADIYAFQEIASNSAFFALTDSLDGFRGFTSPDGQSQRTAYLFRTAVVDSVSSGLLTENQEGFDWAGRLPLHFEADVTIDGITRRIHLYTVHAKAFGDQPSYNRRRSASISLKEYLDENRRDDRVIFLGDYNDRLTRSTYDGAEHSPYQNFLDDDHYYAVTYTLEESGFVSFLIPPNRSMIDHITINRNLFDYHIEGAQRVENPYYIDDFESTTSDHAPVWTRFQFTGFPDELPRTVQAEPNYPNPFNPATTIPFILPDQQEVSVFVYDILGRRVAVVAENRVFAPGENSVEFDAQGLSSGVYLYRIEFEDGTVVTDKMMLIK